MITKSEGWTAIPLKRTAVRNLLTGCQWPRFLYPEGRGLGSVKITTAVVAGKLNRAVHTML